MNLERVSPSTVNDDEDVIQAVRDVGILWAGD